MKTSFSAISVIIKSFADVNLIQKENINGISYLHVNRELVRATYLLPSPLIAVDVNATIDSIVCSILLSIGIVSDSFSVVSFYAKFQLTLRVTIITYSHKTCHSIDISEDKSAL